MTYDIAALTRMHRACLDGMAKHFKKFFLEISYDTKLPTQVRLQVIRSPSDLSSILAGPGFYCIATTLPISYNRCTLRLGAQQAPVVYRGHSHTVRERIESHLFCDAYKKRDSGRRFTVCMKLDGKNINIDSIDFSKYEWLVATHSMPKSKVLIREAAELGFDAVFERPIGSNRE
ncbi:hypothetical protein [Cognatiluteimonas telluris]|uniref:hypothetical protein n=1 Tax=Cognatiluteimonas telluris TaxID=1104775 RepID=UPI0014088513|nr:hypothetical protein [Lysobacter telluris]